MKRTLQRVASATASLLLVAGLAGCGDDPSDDRQSVDLAALPSTVVGPAGYQPAARRVTLGRMGAAIIQADVQQVVTPEPPLPIVAKKMSAPAPTPAPSLAQPSPAVQSNDLPAPPVNTEMFQVYFDFAVASVTPASQSVIQKAAAAVAANKVTTISVTGHTDTVGTDKFNLDLSIRRAEAVKEMLIKLGVPAGEIMISGVGKADQQVMTADGVREQQNRRVVIVMH